MEEHVDLKKTGLKATLPRIKVLNIFESNREEHLSAEDIYKIILNYKIINIFRRLSTIIYIYFVLKF